MPHLSGSWQVVPRHLSARPFWNRASTLQLELSLLGSDWSSDVFNGSARWNYCFTFDEHFNSIQSGQVLCFDLEGRLTSVSHYGLDEHGSMGMLYLRSSGPPPSHASEAA